MGKKWGINMKKKKLLWCIEYIRNLTIDEFKNMCIRYVDNRQDITHGNLTINDIITIATLLKGEQNELHRNVI